MVNFFTVTGGKLIECQKQEIGKLIGCQCGKQIQCQVVNFFIDIHRQLHIYILRPFFKLVNPLYPFQEILCPL